MIERPKSVTIIGWVLIIIGGISLVTTSLSLGNPASKEFMARSPLPASVQYMMMYAGVLVMIVCGIAMLKRRNWARFLYMGWGIVNFIIAFATSPVKTAMIPSVIFFLVIAFFLFRSNASEYFKAAPPAGHGA